MLSLCGDILGTKEAQCDEQTGWFMLREQSDAKQNGPSGLGGGLQPRAELMSQS